MLKPENRLKKVRDFNLLMNYGRWANGDLLNLKYLPLKIAREHFPKKENPDNFEKQLKIAITVGLKIDKRAVVRNRLRRQMSEAVRLLIKDGKVRDGYYLLLVAKKDMLDKEYEEIAKDIKNVLKKSGAL